MCSPKDRSRFVGDATEDRGGHHAYRNLDNPNNNNTATSVAGGIYNQSGGTLTATGSTIEGNVGTSSGGVYSNGTRNLSNTTITNNTPGMIIFGTATLNNLTMSGNSGSSQISGAASVRNSIFTNNGTCSGTNLVTLGFNIIDWGRPCTPPSDVGGDPLLSALASNGGPAQTMALGAGSPALGTRRCTDSAGATIAVDQRGSVRPQGGGCDIGTFESNLARPAQTFPLPSRRSPRR